MITGHLNRFFDIPGHGSTLRREITAGVVTFISIAYIIIENCE